MLTYVVEVREFEHTDVKNDTVKVLKYLRHGLRHNKDGHAHISNFSTAISLNAHSAYYLYGKIYTTDGHAKIRNKINI